jgi:DNA invertase Pin-like site-specific DNA recombinase
MPPRLNPVPDAPPRVVGYVRVSTAREEMISPEIQRQAIEDHCARKGYALEEVIEDLDATGRNFARAGVQRAIERVENAGVAAVVVWKFSRFGRNRKGWALNLGRLEDAGGHLESATEAVDVTTSSGRLSRGMFAEIAAFESDRIGETWAEAHDHRIANGLPHDGRPRFGYLYHRTTITTRDGIRVCPQGCEMGACTTGYVPNPGNQAAASNLYTRYLDDGASFRWLAIWLNDNGYLTNRGGLWDPRAVRRYMDSGFAAGLLREHPTDCKCKTPHGCEKSTFTPGAHEALISVETFELYRTARRRRATYAPRVESPAYALTGLLFCSKCSGPMNAHSKNLPKRGHIRGYVYFCANNTRNRACPGTSLVRAQIEDRVRAWLDTLADELSKQAEKVYVAPDPRPKPSGPVVTRQALLEEQGRIEDAIADLTVKLGRKVISERAYKVACSRLEAEADQVERSLEDASVLAVHPPVPKGPPAHLVRDLTTLWPVLPADRKNHLMRQLVERIVLAKTGHNQADIECTTTWGVTVPI